MKTRRSKRKSALNEIPIPINIIEADTQCLHCRAEFLDEEDLKMHIEQVHSRAIVLCKFCSAKLSGLEEYVTHFITSHLEMVLICYYCHRAFLNRAAFKQHELKHCVVQDEPITCSHCTQMFASRYELQRHEYQLHNSSEEGVLLNEIYSLLSSALNMQVTKFLDALANNKPVFCLMCNHYSTSIIDYVDHLNTSSCKSFACDKCFRIYKRKDGVLRHILSQPQCQNINKEVTQQCYKCKKVFDQKDIYQHKESCKAEKCNTCGVICMSIYELAEHKVNEHKVTQSVTLVMCTFCKREFVGEESLKKHIDRVHKNGELYKYGFAYCDNRFTHPKRLFAHFFTKHKEISPYTCKICDKKFRIRKKFTIHIKLDHKSVGFVEFDQNLHVIFTDKKSLNPILPAIPEGFGCDTEQLNKSSEGIHEKEAMNIEETTDKTETKPIEKTADTDNTQHNSTIDPATAASHNDDMLDINSEEFEEVSQINEPSDLNTEKNRKKRRRRGVSQRSPRKKATKVNIDLDFSEDEPLSKIKKRANNKNVTAILSRQRGRRNAKNQTAKLTCKICKKYCYTFQNYHHHMSLHEKSMLKRCIKCLQYFKSKDELNDHINRAHSTSKLTETLKSLLEKRKKNQTEKENSNMRPADTLKSLLEQRKKAQLMNAQNSITNRFRRTIKKVNVSDDTSVTITPMTDHGLSVKRYIENFRPDNVDGINISSSVTFNPLTTPVERPPVIKLKKFREEPTTSTGRLSFPVKFKDCSADIQSNVTVKLVQELLTKPMSLNFFYDERIPALSPTPDKGESDDYCNTFADDVDYTQYKNDPSIPEVAHEVMLGEAEDVPRIRQLAQEIIIPNISEEHGGVRIAHLTTKAPFYKIVEVKKLLNPPEPEKSKEEEDIKNGIELPDGTHLVSVKNPYSHLIPNDDLQKVVKAQHTNKYYRPKVKNIQQAFIQALKNLNKPPKPRESRRKKKEKDSKSETETIRSFETVNNNQSVEVIETIEFENFDTAIDAGGSLESIEMS